MLQPVAKFTPPTLPPEDELSRQVVPAFPPNRKCNLMGIKLYLQASAAHRVRAHSIGRECGILGAKLRSDAEHRLHAAYRLQLRRRV